MSLTTSLQKVTRTLFVLLATVFILLSSSSSSSKQFPLVLAANSYLNLGISTLGRLASMYYDASRDLIVITGYTNHIIRIYKVQELGGYWINVAGVSGSAGTDDAASGGGATFNAPWGVVGVFPKTSPDQSTGYLISDKDNNCIRHMEAVLPYGVVTAAGMCGTPGSQDGIGSTARVKSPHGITMVFPSRHILIGQDDDNCVRVAKPSPSEDANGYRSLDVGVAAGACSSGAASFNSQPLLARFDRPHGVTGTKLDIAYVCESTKRLYRLQPARFGEGNNAVLTDLGLQQGGGHIHNLLSIPQYGNQPFILFFGKHSGSSQIIKLTDDELKNSEFTTPNWIDIAAPCLSSTSLAATLIGLPNGTMMDGHRDGPENLRMVTENKVSCDMGVRPKYTFYYGKDAQTRTPTLPTKTRSRSKSSSPTNTSTETPTESPSLSNSSTITESDTLSDSDSISENITSSRSISSSSTQTKSQTPPPTKTRSHSPSLPSSSHTQSPERTPSHSLFETISPTLLPTPSSTLQKSENTTSLSVEESETITDVPTETISLPVPKKILRPEPTVFGKEGLTATAAVSIISGAPGVALSIAKLQAAIQLANCGKNPEALEEDMEFLANPFGARIGPGPTLQSQRAAAFLNVYFVGIFAVVVLIAAFIMTKCTERNFSQSLMRLRFPGILSLPLAIMVPGTAESTASLWFYSSRLTDWCLAIFATFTVCLGPLVLMALVTLPGWCKSVLHPLKREIIEDVVVVSETPEESRSANNGSVTSSSKDRPLLSSTSEADEMNSDQMNNDDHRENSHQLCSCSCDSFSKLIPRPVVRVWIWLTAADREWFDYDKPPPGTARKTIMMKGDVEERGEWTEKYGAVFEDFTVSYAVLIDVLAALALGWCAGVAIGVVTRPACLMWLSACCFISLAHLYFFLVKRPVLTRIRLYFMIFASAVTFITVLLATLQFLGEITGFTITAGVILDIQVVVGFLAAVIEVLGLLIFIIEIWDAYKTGKDKFDARGDTRNFAIFDDNFLQELDDNIANHAADRNSDDEIDIAAILNGSPSSAENLDNLEVDLTEFLHEDEEEEDLLVPNLDNHEDDAIAVDIQTPPPEEEDPSKNYTQYQLEEDDAKNNGGYALDDDSANCGDGEGEDEGGKVGSAQVANAQQLKELREMMEKSKRNKQK